MSKRAVDIVLLPDQATAQAAIDANAKLIAEFGQEIVLNKKNCLPHISLALGCLDETDIHRIELLLRPIVEDFPPGLLKTAGVAISANAKGRSVSVLVIARDKKLLSLHYEVMNRLESYLDSNVTADMIYPSGKIADSTLLWIKNYRTTSAFAKFLPHITLGYGRLGDFSFPAEFYPSKLALCHLGNHCTCRKILAGINF